MNGEPNQSFLLPSSSTVCRRREGGRNREQGKPDRLLGLGQHGDDDRECHRNQHAAREALDRAPHDHLLEVFCQGTRRGGHWEQNGVDEKVDAQEEYPGQPAGQRNDDNLSDIDPSSLTWARLPHWSRGPSCCHRPSFVCRLWRAKRIRQWRIGLQTTRRPDTGAVEGPGKAGAELCLELSLRTFPSWPRQF
jgi:hypothetical protein